MCRHEPPSFPDFFANALATLKAGDTWDTRTLHASDLGATIPGEGCLRRLYLRLNGAPERPATTGKILQLEKSKDFHVFLSRLLSRFAGDIPGGWELLEIEGGATMEGAGSGTLDVLLRHRESGALCVKDFKTMNGSGFVFLKKEGQAKAPHILQVQRYMMARDAQVGQVCYIDREGGAGIYEPPAFGRDDEAVRAAWEALKAGTASLPPPLLPVVKDDIPQLPWMCRYLTRTGEEEVCGYLDTEHCPGALPPAQRPAEDFIWRKIKIAKKKGA